MFNSVRTVMTFAPDPGASARWWGELLDVPVRTDVSDAGGVHAWNERPRPPSYVSLRIVPDVSSGARATTFSTAPARTTSP